MIGQTSQLLAGLQRFLLLGHWEREADGLLRAGAALPHLRDALVEPFEVLLVDLVVVPVDLVAVLAAHLSVVFVQLRQLAKSLHFPLLLAPAVLFKVAPLIVFLLRWASKLSSWLFGRKEVYFILLLVLLGLLVDFAGVGQLACGGL